MKTRRNNASVAKPTNQEMVYLYFDLITRKDIEGLLDLFMEDATILEPFSNLPDGLHGKREFENFFKVVLMANAGMNRKKIEFVEEGQNGDETEDRITAFVTYERGDTIESRLDFQFAIDASRRKRIRGLKIQFC